MRWSSPAFRVVRGTIEVVPFDLEDVAMQTAKLQVAARKELFDNALRQRAGQEPKSRQRFDPDTDDHRYNDGSLRR